LVTAAPFLKWVGGKRQLMSDLLENIPRDWKHYYEPFVGGGALFFALANADYLQGGATLGDSNDVLVRTYLAVKNDVEQVIESLQGCVYSKEEYYQTRALDPNRMDDDCDVAAWMIYLNKTCFNGLWRVNQSGRFNVPMGRYDNPTICDSEGLRAASLALREAKAMMRTADFERTLRSAEEGDFVYFDPPYVAASATSNFTGYSKGGFGPAEQARLRDVAEKLKARGVQVLLSNSDTPEVRELYGKGRSFRVERVDARRSVNSKASKRGNVGELLIS
jgi:DNA adenine methylase